MANLTAALREHPLALFADFRRLFIGRLVSAVGDKFFSIAIAWWVISRSGGSALQLGLVMGVTVIPVVIFGPVLGTLVDRSDKRRVMLLADAARALCVLTLAWLLYSDSLTLPALYALCFLISAFGPLFESAVSSSILRLSSPEKLAGATATDASVVQFSGVAGSALGSILLAVAGVAGAFLLNAVSFLVSFFAVLLIRTDLRPAGGRAGASSYTGELKDGMKYILDSRPLLALLCVFAAFNFFIGPLLILIPMIVRFTLKESVTWLAVFETFFALGAAAASAAASFRKKWSGFYGTFFRSVLFLGLAFGGLYFTADKYVICALLFAAGAALGAGNAAALTLFQHTVPDGMKGRFFAVLTTICCAALPLTFMLNGFLAGKFSVGFCIALNSTAVLAISGVILLIPKLETGD
jgi:MFS family permease